MVNSAGKLTINQEPGQVYTSLDFIWGKLDIPDDAPILDVMFSLIGRMEIDKSLFLEGGYQNVTQTWDFLHKNCYCTVSPNMQSIFAFRFNQRLPAGSCPLIEPTHECLPPSLNRKDVRVTYFIQARLNYLDGSHENIVEAIPFMPRSLAVPGTGDVYKLNEYPEADRRFAITEKLVSMFGANLGSVEVVSTIPGRYHTSLDSKSIAITFPVEICWHGERKRLPELRQLHAAIKVFQEARQRHHHEGDFKPPPLLLDTLRLEKQELEFDTAYPQYWKEVRPDCFRATTQVNLTYTSDGRICPTFVTCLWSQTYKLQLKFGLHLSSLSSGKDRYVTVEVPISIKSSIQNGPDIDPDFMIRWNKCLQGPDLSPEDLVEFWKSDSRKPEYGEALDTIIHPAPSRELPRYVPEAIDAAESSRVPSWQIKEERRSSSSSNNT